VRKIEALTRALVNENAVSAFFDKAKIFWSAQFSSLYQTAIGIAQTHRLDAQTTLSRQSIFRQHHIPIA
jgi:hypothetical protein